MNVLIDTKNIAIFGSGITAYIKPVLEHWIKQRPDIHFYLTGPSFDYKNFLNLSHESNYDIVDVPFPFALPRPMRHLVYDNMLFPKVVNKVKPDFIFSPYHDVRLPKKIPSAMMIHDTCLKDLTKIYPLKVRAYYEHMLKVNLKRSSEILTVSESSKLAISQKYSYPEHKINVVYNTLDDAFLNTMSSSKMHTNTFDILYTGGNEYRKNISRLLDALELLQQKQSNAKLLVTGGNPQVWQRSLSGRSENVINAVHLLGRLSIADLGQAYVNADVVIYPSLCEGFGRSCLEAMATGTPVACSNLPALREVSNEYAIFFNPYSAEDIADKVIQAKLKGKQKPILDSRFLQATVNKQFSDTLNRLIESYCHV